MRDLFHARVKELRKEKGITQSQFALEIGVTKGTVSTWERGARKPEPHTVQAMADYFNVSVPYLLGYSDNRLNYQPACINEGLTQKLAYLPLLSVSSQRALNSILDYMLSVEGIYDAPLE